MGRHTHTFATPYLVLVATRRRSDANLAGIAAVTLSNDAEAACNSGVKSGYQGVLLYRRSGTHIFLYLDSTRHSGNMSSGMQYTESVGQEILANNKTGKGDCTAT